MKYSTRGWPCLAVALTCCALEGKPPRTDGEPRGPSAAQSAVSMEIATLGDGSGQVTGTVPSLVPRGIQAQAQPPHAPSGDTQTMIDPPAPQAAAPAGLPKGPGTDDGADPSSGSPEDPEQAPIDTAPAEGTTEDASAEDTSAEDTATSGSDDGRAPMESPTEAMDADADMATDTAVDPAGMAATQPDGSAEADPAAPTLRAVLQARLMGDRTGACIAAARIGTQRETAIVCANPEDEASLSYASPFELGAVTKTMTAFAVAQLIEDGRLGLEDPIADHLPVGTEVPRYADGTEVPRYADGTEVPRYADGTEVPRYADGTEVPRYADGSEVIRVKHLLTHTAGLPPLPSRMQVSDPLRPYATLEQTQVLASLPDVQLQQAPFGSWAYSNYGFMLLSIIVSEESGQPYDRFLAEQLFAPLQMKQSYVSPNATQDPPVPGHTGARKVTPAWDMAPAVAGFGGVRASLEDMALYAEAWLGQAPARMQPAIKRTLTKSAGITPTMGLGWLQMTTGQRTAWMHDGGTGGFSSFIAIDPDRQEAVVILADTALSAVGGVVPLGMHLLAPADVPLEQPRLAVDAPEPLLQALIGSYRLGDLEIDLRAQEGKLIADIVGLGSIPLNYDDHGDFYPGDADSLLTPLIQADGSYAFQWVEGGAPLVAERLAP